MRIRGRMTELKWQGDVGVADGPYGHELASREGVAMLACIELDGLGPLRVMMRAPPGGQAGALEAGSPTHVDGRPYDGPWNLLGFAEWFESQADLTRRQTMIMHSPLAKTPEEWGGFVFNPPREFDLPIETED